MNPHIGMPLLTRQLRDLMGERACDARGVVEQHGRSEAYHPEAAPDLVVFPESTAEVARIVALCGAAGLPMVAFGAGTALEGQTAATSGGVCLDMSRMDRLLEVNAADMDCRIQPGIRRKALNAQLRDTGLFFPNDPGADATLGGMASTRASGTLAVRYGTMKDNVIALEVVTPDAQVIRTASRARKTSAGYDLTRLFVGAEGTLGIITELTLKLYAHPPAISSAVCSFATLEGAVDSVIATIQAGVPIARIELLDEVMMRGVNRHAGLAYAEAPTLFYEFHGTDAGVAEQAALTQAVASEYGGAGFAWAIRPEERSRLWLARDNTLYAAKALRPDARGFVTDVCVPLSRLAECVVETKRDILETDLVAPIVGHVGDGNFHCNIMIDPEDPAELARAKAFHGRLVRRAMAMGGTCTGEHGIGLGKKDFLQEELGGAVDVMRRIKQALDPQGLMNPGKIFDPIAPEDSR